MRIGIVTHAECSDARVEALKKYFDEKYPQAETLIFAGDFLHIGKKTIENRKLQDQIFEVRVPLQDVVEMKGGVKKNVSKKMFPGYVLVNMVMNDDTWYVVRNTRGVTGFVGPGSDPVPLSEAEMRNLGIVAQSDNEVEIDIEIGDLVEVTSGAWEGRVSTVTAINMNKQTVTIEVDMFGRETSVEIGFLDVKKL